MQDYHHITFHLLFDLFFQVVNIHHLLWRFALHQNKEDHPVYPVDVILPHGHLYKAQINHLNKVKTDNRVENLEWATCSENIKHSYSKGRISPATKLSQMDIKWIKTWVSLGYTKKDIAKAFNISAAAIWYHINKEVSLPDDC